MRKEVLSLFLVKRLVWCHMRTCSVN